jgi:hypothetical protein
MLRTTDIIDYPNMAGQLAPLVKLTDIQSFTATKGRGVGNALRNSGKYSCSDGQAGTNTKGMYFNFQT